MKLSQNDKQYLHSLYSNGQTPQEISIAVGISENAVKRALADLKVLNLSWYKTKEQHSLLTHLESLGITNTTQFATYRDKLLFQNNPLTGS